MTYPISRRRRLVAAATLLLLLVLAVFAAAQARADGEDDPTFGDAGTAFADIGRGFSELGPFVRQAPNGQVYAAIGDDRDLRGGSIAGVQVARFDSAGQPLSIAGEDDGVARLPVEFEVLIDFAIMANGDLVFAGTRFATPPSRGGEPAVVLERFSADGVRGDGRMLFSGLDCVGDQFVEAARITSDGGAVVAWNGCQDVEELNADTRGVTEREEGSLVTRHPAEGDQSNVIVPESVDQLTHLELGPNGQVFALGLPNSISGRGFDNETLTLRFRNDPSGDLEFDPSYDQGPLPGEPVDLAVDGSGRAHVWFDEQIFFRGGDEPGTWSIARRQAVTGVLDDGWGEEGVVDLSDDRIGPERYGKCNTCPDDLSHLAVQSDGKVIALGLADYPVGQRGEDDATYRERVLVRFEADGDVDPTWGDEGFKPYVLGQPDDEGESSEFEQVTSPAFQSDGKLLVPFAAFTSVGKRPRVPTPPEGRSMGVTRIGLTPAEQPPGEQPPPQQPAAAVVPPVSVAAPSQAAKACKSRRRFAITLRTGRRKAERSPIASAVVRVNGKRVTVTRAARRRASVNLTNLPPGRFTVSISLRLKDGGTVRETRRYRTCAKKVERELGPLRTRAPRSKRS